MRRSDLFQRTRELLCGTGPGSRCLSVAVLFALTYALERLLPFVAEFDHGWAVWWPTNGVTLALLLIAPKKHWPFILLPITVATAMQQPPVPGSSSFLFASSVGNCVEVLIPALMLPRFCSLTGWLQAPRLAWKFVISAVCLGPASSSLLMGLYFKLTMHQSFWYIAGNWGIADVVGMVMFTPLTLVLISPETYILFRWRRLSGTLGVLSLLTICCWFVFQQTSYPDAFLISPILLLVATRCGFSGSVLAINLLALLATSATLHGLGPFALLTGVHEPYRVPMLQLFLILALLMAFPISIARLQQESTTAQLKTAYLQMQALAAADGLTGLANRRRFDAALETEWRRGLRNGQPVAVLMLDADRFKTYNDRYGHPAGDLCLQQIAKAICDIPRRTGDLVARYGGEEFVILLPGIDGAGAYSVGEQVRQNVRLLGLPHQDNPAGRVTISVGCAAMMPSHSTSAAALLKGSDQALYTAKQNGRDQTCVHEWQESQTERYFCSPAEAAIGS
jgi:diguanylate cyclase (GGDEF)-like protein